MNDLPEDLAKPRRDRASFIANVVTASSLLVVMLLLGWLYMVWTAQ